MFAVHLEATTLPQFYRQFLPRPSENCIIYIIIKIKRSSLMTNAVFGKKTWTILTPWTEVIMVEWCVLVFICVYWQTGNAVCIWSP